MESEMAYNTSRTLDKQTCTEYVDKCQERFGRIFWSKNDSNYPDIKLKVFKREDKKADFRLRQNFKLGEADFNQCNRQRNQLVVAADNFLGEQNLSPVLHFTLSKDMEDQLKLVQKVTDVVDRPNRRFCVTLLRHELDNQRPAMFKFVYSDGRRRKKSSNKLCMSSINLRIMYIFLTS